MRKLPEDIIRRADIWNELIRPERFKPFRIDVDFRIGRNGNDVIAFDAILSHYIFRYVLGTDAFNISLDHDERLKLKIPLMKIQWGMDYFFLSSWLPGVPEKSTFWTKRFSKRLLSSVTKRRVSTQVGEYRSYKMPTLYDDRMHYTIFGTGDIALIRRVLPTQFHIGKNAASGYGECTYRIQPQRSENWMVYFGILQRPLPVEFCHERGWYATEPILVQRPICPPYFGTNSRYYDCYDVGTKMEHKG